LAHGLVLGLTLPLFFVLALGGSIALAYFVARSAGRKMAENLAAVAAQLGLEYREERVLGLVTKARIEGLMQGRAVRIWNYSTGSGKSRTHYAAAGVRPRRAGGLTFRITRQGMLSKLSELFGAKEITVGDARFDDAWFVQTNQPELLAAALVPDIRDKLMALHREAGRGSLRLEEGEVVYAEVGQLSDLARVRRLAGLLPLLRDLADVAEVAAGAGR